MTLTETSVRACATDEALFKLLSQELHRLIPDEEGDDLDLFLSHIQTIPVGLRAMAATYQLDVSVTLDDFGWHFANWHHRAYCEETIWALRELEAFEPADLFERAYALAQPYWDTIGELVADDFQDFVQWYNGSALETATDPLIQRMWELQKIDSGLFGYWTSYARKYPHKVMTIH